MTSTASDAIHLDFPFSLLDRIWAAFVLIPQRKLNIVIHSVIPLIGIGIFVALVLGGRAIDLQAWIVIVSCLLFTPLITVLAVLINYATNSTFRGRFTYTFDAVGIHVQAATYQYTNPWSAIFKVKSIGGFLLFFIAPGVAHCIPLKAVYAARQYDALLLLACNNGVQSA